MGTIAHQAPLSMGFPRQEYWSGLPFPSPGDLSNPGIKSTSPVWRVDSLPLTSVLCYGKSLSCVQFFATPWTIARQHPLFIRILQAGVLEWVAVPSSRGSSQPRNRTGASCFAGGFFTSWAIREAHPWGLPAIDSSSVCLPEKVILLPLVLKDMQASLTLLCFILLCFVCIVFVTQWGSVAALGQAALLAPFPSHSARFVSRCHTLVMPKIFQTLHKQKGYDSLKAQIMVSIFRHKAIVHLIYCNTVSI